MLDFKSEDFHGARNICSVLLFFYTFGQWSLTIYTPSPLPPQKK